MFPRVLVAIVFVSFFSFAEAPAQSQQSQRYQPVELNVPRPQSELFEVSLGFNYIYLSDQSPETKNLYGLDTSLFINAASWLGIGGDFMTNFGSRSVPVFFRNTVDIDSRRFVYVFGPRITVWRNPRFRVFAEALAGGVHAEAELTSSRFIRTASASDDGFAAAIGAGFDWRLTDNLSWRVVQADYLPTTLGSGWQSNFRASTAIVYSFGHK